MTLPNLLVIGAAKCGTTSLHHYLAAHPEIAMSAEKELNYFVAEKNGGRSLTWYESQFDGTAPVRGESSPAYTAYPCYAGVPERIHSVVPEARLVYVVRDPIERVVSHYQLLQGEPELGSLEDVLEHPFHGGWMIAVSRYWSQLEQYHRFFSPGRILVVDADQLRDCRQETLARVFRFVGVDPGYDSGELDRLHNVSTPATRPNRIGSIIRTGLERAVGARGARAIAHRVPRPLKAPFRRVADQPAVTPELRERLAEEFRPEVERLRAHTGEAFAGWSV